MVLPYNWNYLDVASQHYVEDFERIEYSDEPSIYFPDGAIYFQGRYVCETQLKSGSRATFCGSNNDTIKEILSDEQKFQAFIYVIIQISRQEMVDEIELLAGLSWVTEKRTWYDWSHYYGLNMYLEHGAIIIKFPSDSLED